MRLDHFNVNRLIIHHENFLAVPALCHRKLMLFVFVGFIKCIGLADDRASAIGCAMLLRVDDRIDFKKQFIRFHRLGEIIHRPGLIPFDDIRFLGFGADENQRDVFQILPFPHPHRERIAIH